MVTFASAITNLFWDRFGHSGKCETLLQKNSNENNAIY